MKTEGETQLERLSVCVCVCVCERWAGRLRAFAFAFAFAFAMPQLAFAFTSAMPQLRHTAQLRKMRQYTDMVLACVWRMCTGDIQSMSRHAEYVCMS